MRLYKKLKPILSGVTADINNKGILLINSNITTSANCDVYFKNLDGSIKNLNFTLATGAVPFFAPNISIIPFEVQKWVDTSTPPGTTAPKAYILY